MPNGNQPAFNTNLPIAGACYQLAPQMSFTPQPLCNVTASPNLQQNRSNNHPQSSQNANSNRRYGPRNFSTKKFQHDQEVCHLNALLKQERGSNSKLVRDKKYLEEQCAKINDELLEKNAELETLKQSNVSRKAVRDATTQVQFDKCSRQCETKTRHLQEKLDETIVQHDDVWHQMKRYKDKFERSQNENPILTKKKPGEDSCRNHSLQISELRRENKKFREEKKVLENHLKADLEALKSRIENLQAELQQCKKELKTTEEENRELKVTNEQISRESQQKLNQMASENEAKAITYAKLYETFEGLQRDLDLKVKDNSLQLSKLNNKNKKLEKENEMMKANHKPCFDCDLEASTPMTQKLQTELDNRKAELLHCSERLEKAEEENNRLKNENSKLNQDLDDFEDIVDKNAKNILRLQNSGGDSEQLKSDLDTCRVQMESYRADLKKAREEKNDIVAERERLKAELKTSNDTIEICAEKRAKLGLKLKMHEDKCKGYIAEIENLKQNSAQSQILKAELASAKTENERLSNMNKELKKESKRLWNKVFVDSSDGQGSSEAKDDGNSGPTPPKKKKPNNAK